MPVKSTDPAGKTIIIHGTILVDSDDPAVWKRRAERWLQLAETWEPESAERVHCANMAKACDSRYIDLSLSVK